MAIVWSIGLSTRTLRPIWIFSGRFFLFHFLCRKFSALCSRPSSWLFISFSDRRQQVWPSLERMKLRLVFYKLTKLKPVVFSCLEYCDVAPRLADDQEDTVLFWSRIQHRQGCTSLLWSFTVVSTNQEVSLVYGHIHSLRPMGKHVGCEIPTNRPRRLFLSRSPTSPVAVTCDQPLSINCCWSNSLEFTAQLFA